MTVYVDTDALKASLELVGSTHYDDDLDSAALAASVAIDNLLGRRFGKSTEDEARLYSTTGRVSPFTIDDLVALTSVTVDRDGDGTFEETWTRDTDFRLLPLNAEASSLPWRQIEVMTRGRYSLPRTGGVLKVTGRFGWGSPPAPVVEAATLLATQLYKRKREAPFGVQALSVGDATVAAQIARRDPHISMLLQPYNATPLFV